MTDRHSGQVYQMRRPLSASAAVSRTMCKAYISTMAVVLMVGSVHGTEFEALVRSALQTDRGVDLLIHELSESLRNDRKDASTYYLRSFCWQRKGELEKAISDITKAMDLDSGLRRAEVVAWRAALFAENEQYDLAITDLNEAMRLDPSNTLHIIFKGLLLVSTGENALALKEFQRAVQTDPKSVDSHCYLGRVALETENVAIAIDAFLAASHLIGAGTIPKLAENRYEADTKLAKIFSGCWRFEQYGDPKKSLHHASLACHRSNLESFKAMEMLSIALYVNEAYEQAEQWLHHAIALAPSEQKARLLPGLNAFRKAQASRPRRSMPLPIGLDTWSSQTRNARKLERLPAVR